MNIKFVTAIYTNLFGTKFNGNPDAIYPRYKESLLSLVKGGYEIVCYTSSKHIEELTAFYKDYPNIKLIVSELEDHPFHSSIEKIKDKYAKYTVPRDWSSRCVEIMWGKFFWLKEVINGASDNNHVYWIDAGIFHGGLIPKKYKSVNSVGDFDFDKITQQRNLYSDLVEFSGDKILNIQSTWVNHGMEDFQHVFGYSPEYGVIGGIFGGPKDKLSDYIDGMIELMEKVLSSDRLLKEEEIMYVPNYNSPELFTNFRFNSWYHEEWDDIFDPEVDIGMSDFFEVIRGT